MTECICAGCSSFAEVMCSNPACQGDSDDLCQFTLWIEDLSERVIQGEYGYEPGEFAVYPSHWFPLFQDGLTPDQAYRRALEAHRDGR